MTAKVGAAQRVPSGSALARTRRSPYPPMPKVVPPMASATPAGASASAAAVAEASGPNGMSSTNPRINPAVASFTSGAPRTAACCIANAARASSGIDEVCATLVPSMRKFASVCARNVQMTAASTTNAVPHTIASRRSRAITTPERARSSVAATPVSATNASSTTTSNDANTPVAADDKDQNQRPHRMRRGDVALAQGHEREQAGERDDHQRNEVHPVDGEEALDARAVQEDAALGKLQPFVAVEARQIRIERDERPRGDGHLRDGGAERDTVDPLRLLRPLVGRSIFCSFGQLHIERERRAEERRQEEPQDRMRRHRGERRLQLHVQPDAFHVRGRVVRRDQELRVEALDAPRVTGRPTTRPRAAAAPTAG